MFARSAASDPLTQGDVIEDCPLVGLNVAVLPVDLNAPATKWWTAQCDRIDPSVRSGASESGVGSGGSGA